MMTDTDCLLEKCYTKASLFEAARLPFVSEQTAAPDYKLEINIHSANVAENHYEVGLTLAATVKTGETPLYRARVQQGGIFTLKPSAILSNELIINTLCPTLLYPYAVERLENLVMHAGFPSLNLAPVNFEKLYQNKEASEIKVS
jgi:preprotein translocase subunit SecB